MSYEKKVEKKMIKWLLVSTTLIMTLIFTVLAQDGAAAGDQASATANAEDKKSAEIAPVGDEVTMVVDEDVENSGTPSIQSMKFGEDCSIKRALVILGALYKKNIVPSAQINDVPVPVSSLYNVTFQEAIEAIIGENKYDISESGNFIQVYTPEEYQLKLKPYRRELYYITASEAKNIIAPLMSANGTIASTSATGDSEPGKGGDSIAIRDTIVIKDFKKNIDDIEEAIDQIDVMPPQILIEVTILEATLDETTQFGIDFNLLTGNTVKVDGFAGTGAKGLSLGVVNGNIDVFVTALDEITDTTILANPKIMALNKQAGKLLIGTEDGYLTVSTVSDGGNATQTVDFLEVGTKLEFRPFICKDNFIRMELSPEQSTGSVDGDTGLPKKNTTTVETSVMVEDGRTIVLGGLFQEKTELTRSQVPFVGDIPVVGEAFKKINDQSVRKELIVLITPHIINSPVDADASGKLEDVNRLVYKARKDITWLSRVRRAEDRYDNAVKLYRQGKKDEALCQLNTIFEKTRNYLEIERLRDRIIQDKFPGSNDCIQRIMLQKFQEEESAKWYRNLKNPPVINNNQ